MIISWPKSVSASVGSVVEENILLSSDNRLSGGCDSPQQTGNHDPIVKFISFSVELLLHKECLESHCAEVVEALRKERAEFLQFCDQQNNVSKTLRSQIRDMESVFLSAPVTEK